MATIITRSGKGSALTFAELDANFNNLNAAKLEVTAGYVAPAASGFRMENNRYLAGFTVAGVQTRLFGLSTTDALLIGSIDVAGAHSGGHSFMNGGAQVAALSQVGNFTALPNLNGAGQIACTNANAGTAAEARVAASNGTDTMRLTIYGASHATTPSRGQIVLTGANPLQVISNAVSRLFIEPTNGYMAVGVSTAPLALVDIGDKPEQLRVTRNTTQYVSLTSNSTISNHMLMAYSASSNAKIFDIGVTTDTLNTTPTAGTALLRILVLGQETARFVSTATGNAALFGITTQTGNANVQVSTGVRFNGTASADVNTLDAYQEGTFTPTIVGLTTAGAGTYTTQTGRYTRMGNRVHFALRVVISAHTGTGNMAISGLPFSSNASAATTACAIATGSLTYTGGLVAWINAGTSQISLGTMSSGVALSSNLAMDTACDLMISGTYEV